MNLALLRLLACPYCGAEALDLTTFEDEDEARVREGLLRCSACGVAYPVVAGIPRLIPGIGADFPDFVARHPESAGLGWSGVESRLQPTKESYSRWWEDVQRDMSYRLDNQAIWEARTGLTSADVVGSVALDAGCGNGRLSKVLVDNGCEHVVAMDLGRSVELARRYVGARPGFDVVQGDVLRPPLRREVFDYVMSIGVLHHTPHPEAAFRALSEVVKQNGLLSVYLYERDTVRWNSSYFKDGLLSLGISVYQEPLRVAVSKLPHRAILAWSRVLWWKRQRIEALKRAGKPLRHVARAIEFATPRDVYKPLESADFNVVRNYDTYSTRFMFRHTLEELLEWFSATGFASVVVTPYRLSATGSGRRAADEPMSVLLHPVRSIGEIEARGVTRS